jgi:hypothetical protein
MVITNIVKVQPAIAVLEGTFATDIGQILYILTLALAVKSLTTLVCVLK